jgi:hypothetical protein
MAAMSRRRFAPSDSTGKTKAAIVSLSLLLLNVVSDLTSAVDRSLAVSVLLSSSPSSYSLSYEASDYQRQSDKPSLRRAPMPVRRSFVDRGYRPSFRPSVDMTLLRLLYPLLEK